MAKSQQKKDLHGTGRGKREAAALLQRQALVFSRWSAGETQTAIAKSLKKSPATICLDLHAAWKTWRENHRGSVAEHIESELGKLLAVELSAQAKFEDTGSAEFLRILLDVGKERRKLLGLDAPARSEIKADVTATRLFKPKSEMHAEVQLALQRLREQQAKQGKQNGNDD